MFINFKEKKIINIEKNNNTDHNQINSNFILNSGLYNNSKYKLIYKTDFNELLDLIEYKSKSNKNLFRQQIFNFLKKDKEMYNIKFNYLNLWIISKSNISLEDYIYKTNKYLNLYTKKIADIHIRNLLG